MTPQPGDIGLVRTGGWGARLIRWGDWVYARRHHVPHSRFNHAVIYIGGGKFVQAEPHGASIGHVGDYAGISWRTWHKPLPEHTQAGLVATAQSLVGTGYNWPVIAALTLSQLGWDVQRDDGRPTWVGRRLADMSQLICSELTDRVYQVNGLQLFDDGRLPGDVTPGDLDRCPVLTERTP